MKTGTDPETKAFTEMENQAMTEQKTATDLFAQINRPKDPNAMTDLEKKHYPVITAPAEVEAPAAAAAPEEPAAPAKEE